MRQLLDLHFPMPALPASGGTRGPGRPPMSVSDTAVLLTLHMVWTDTEVEDEYPDPGPHDWFHDSAGIQKSSTFPPEGPMSTTTPTASPAPTSHTTIADEPIPISSDRAITLSPERRRSISELPALSLESDSEPELPPCQPAINRKVSWITPQCISE